MLAHLVANSLQRAHGVGLAVPLVATQVRLAGQTVRAKAYPVHENCSDAMKRNCKSKQRETHLVINDLQRAHRVGLAVLLIATQGRLAGDLRTDGPVVVVGVQRADGLACLPGAPVAAQHLLSLENSQSGQAHLKPFMGAKNPQEAKIR